MTKPSASPGNDSANTESRYGWILVMMGCPILWDTQGAGQIIHNRIRWHSRAILTGLNVMMEMKERFVEANGYLGMQPKETFKVACHMYLSKPMHSIWLKHMVQNSGNSTVDVKVHLTHYKDQLAGLLLRQSDGKAVEAQHQSLMGW